MEFEFLHSGAKCRQLFRGFRSTNAAPYQCVCTLQRLPSCIVLQALLLKFVAEYLKLEVFLSKLCFVVLDQGTQTSELQPFPPFSRVVVRD